MQTIINIIKVKASNEVQRSLLSNINKRNRSNKLVPIKLNTVTTDHSYYCGMSMLYSIQSITNHLNNQP